MKSSSAKLKGKIQLELYCIKSSVVNLKTMKKTETNQPTKPPNYSAYPSSIWKRSPVFLPSPKMPLSTLTTFKLVWLFLYNLSATQKASFQKTVVKAPLFSRRWNMGASSKTSACQTPQSPKSLRADASFWAKANPMLNARISLQRIWISAWYFSNKQWNRGAGNHHKAFYGIRHTSHEKRQRPLFLNMSFKDLFRNFLLLVLTRNEASM